MNGLATYSFLPWLRHGVANAIVARDGDPAVKQRASIQVTLTVTGDPVGGVAPLQQTIARDVALYGPGDVVGIDPRAIVRTEPRAWITNFESNYLAAVDFYDEDFPWRYTPATALDPAALRLRPWIALLVLEESEFADGARVAGRPLSFITVPDATVFPAADELWAWAHVHFNQSLSASASEHVSPDLPAVLPRVEAILSANPDLAYSRLLSPRRLEPDTGYHAFIVPAFESGRLAGLGSAPDAAPHATFSAWASYDGRAEPTSHPVYFRWYFRTGSQGDFEFLVRLLQPRPVDPRVGRRDMDVRSPGANLPGIDDAALAGVLRLSGALRVPRASLDAEELATAQRYDAWFAPYPHPFQKALATFVDLADDYGGASAASANAASGLVAQVSVDGASEDDPDPVVTAPLYGRWHALARRLLVERDGSAAPDAADWVHELNLDPQYRVPAGFGAGAIERNAERYVDAAWQQVGDVLAANRLIRRLQLAQEVSTRWHQRHVVPLLASHSERALTITAPVARRVTIGGNSVTRLQRASLVAPVLTSAVLRRVLRPGGRLVRLLPFDAHASPANLLSRVNAGIASAAPPKATPHGVVTLDALMARAARPAPSQPALALRRITAPILRAVGETAQAPATIGTLPRSPDFRIVEPGGEARPTIGTTDSSTAVRFKSALRDAFDVMAATRKIDSPAPAAPLDLQAVAQAVVDAIDPAITIARRGLARIALPPRLQGPIGDALGEVMAYPRIDVPMYEPLKEGAIENFVPNLNLIPANSITLLETNQKFIEAYMVGVNHEFARKLLWREYPTDQRGTYFRQFWEARGAPGAADGDADASREALYDIAQIHRWARGSALGAHDQRAGSTQGAQAVLAIRGEILKKYPTAVIYAQHALWFVEANGQADTTQPRVLDEPTDAEAANPPVSKIRFPLYEARADPDIYFLGFDLTIEAARGGTHATDDAGWFFVIKERPGEPRFGLEVERSAPAETFEDLAWSDALPASTSARFLPAEALPSVALAVPAPDDPDLAQHGEDVQVAAAPVSAARWAYLLLRAPAMIAVHAARMLPEAMSDPRRNLGNLPDRSPFLLLPVRLETRFVTLPPDAVGAQPRHQLWVRIYPDDCSIDTFEPVPSTTEIASARQYWRQMFRAGGMEADERGAWRALVKAHGAGRAGWLADHYQPVNVASKPTKASATDEILVLDGQAALSDPERAAIASYWETMWRAGDSATAEQAATAALEQQVGAARARELVGTLRPFNLADAPEPPLRRNDVALSTAYVQWPDVAAAQSAWTQAPKVRHLADCFVVQGYVGGTKVIEAVGNAVTLPLVTGPDPAADATDQIRPDNGELHVPDALRWLVNFDAALACGMALRIDLTSELAAGGFDRLLVLGVELATTDADGASALASLLAHHAAGRNGLALVAQGTPTNNTAGTPSGYTARDDADAAFDARARSSLFEPTTDATRKQDGQWLAELLGVDPGTFAHVAGADGRDQIDARAMQRALWPATLGYWMDRMLAPVFTDAAVESTRWFFTNYVSGRGAAPALRIGRQPYGILPTTAYSRVRWFEPPTSGAADAWGERRPYLARLLQLLRAISTDWAAMAQSVAHVGKPGDAHATLLDIVGLHPAGVEFHTRTTQSLRETFNLLNLWGVGPEFWHGIHTPGAQDAAGLLVAHLGYTGTVTPQILQHVFLNAATALPNVIDDRPLSESAPLRPCTDDGKNYIEWLIAAARASLDALREEQGFTDSATPQTLLYLFARHALLLGYYDAGYDLDRRAGILSAAQLQASKPEPTFVHVADGAGSESRFARLYATDAHITGNAQRTIAEHIASTIGHSGSTQELADQLDALDLLKDASTARLERAFAEHVDCCSHRLDAWLLGLVNLELQALRARGGVDGAPASGIYLGAFAWLEDLRPAQAALEGVEVAADLAGTFAGAAPLRHDPANGGYVHAPSLPQATTAAVLRSGYLANADDPGALAVDLSSARVRAALSTLEAMRNGQSLGALLGYRFERGLHDAHGLAEVDRFIYPLRKAFPLSADLLPDTATDADVPIDLVEARNVLDGRKLVAHVRTGGNAHYPFGLALPPADAAQIGAIDHEVAALLDLYDALADLALAEGVHQATQGNFDRVAATLDTYASGNHPPDPLFAYTPSAGIGITHKVVLHLQAGLPAGATLRAAAEPALDAWLAGVLPPLARIGCRVTWKDPVDDRPRAAPVTLADLGLGTLDALDLVKLDDSPAMSELDDRVLAFVGASAAPRPDAKLRIEYMTAPAEHALSLFEAAPLLRALRTLTSAGRPWRASDAMLAGEAASGQDAGARIDRARIAGPKARLDALGSDFDAYLADLEPLLAAPVVDPATILPRIDDLIAGAIPLLARAAAFAIRSSGWGFLVEWKRSQFASLIASVSSRVAQWNARLARYDARVHAYDTAPPATEAARFGALEAAQMEIATLLLPRPAAASDLRNALDGRRSTFVARRDALAAVRATGDASFAHLVASVRALLPLDAFDAAPLDVGPVEASAVVIARDLAGHCRARLAEIDARRAACQAQLDAHDAAASAAARTAALQEGAKALFGSDFLILPEYALDASSGGEWGNALATTASDSLLAYARSIGIDFPVDEWLYGAARVRPNLHAWEEMVMLCEAFATPAPRLAPMQLPFEADAPWLALPYPPDYRHDGDRLLYTVCYARPFDAGEAQCGLVIDEWNEVIPASTQTTGLAFNFARPDNEAPQSMLLVAPASANGSWQWDDLAGALNETLDLAKQRAVEPAHVDDTAYARLLPATLMATALYGISIATTLAAAGGAMSHLEGPSHA